MKILTMTKPILTLIPVRAFILDQIVLFKLIMSLSMPLSFYFLQKEIYAYGNKE